jgi:hypothetical protein
LAATWILLVEEVGRLMGMEDGFPESCRVLSQIDFDVSNVDRRRDLFSLIRVLFLQRIFLPLLVLRCIPWHFVVVFREKFLA